MQIAINRLPKSTIELTITIPWSRIKETYANVLSQVASEAEIDGFRKGKAPEKLVEEKVGKNKILEETIRKIIPSVYEEAVKQESIKPVSSPKIQIIEAAESKDWQIKATTCEKPTVDLGNFKDEIANLNAKAKIWVPKEGVPEKDKSTDQGPKKPTIEEILDTLLRVSKVDVPDLLIEEETNRSLTKLVDQTQGLGLSTQDYLKAKGLTQETLRAQFARQSRDTLALEFILEEIANRENITVSEAEINKAIENSPDETTKSALQKDSYILAAILRRQKTLDFLSNL